jgi:DNA polymerase-4
MSRIILHVDMNCFFAAVEQQADPRLRGQPVAVIGSAKRTVILTASYEARAFGVKTGMTVHEARNRCPQLILVFADNRKYTRTSSGIIEILKEFTPQVEVFSIDEAFLDITGSLKLFGPPEQIARLIKERIREDYGLLCSIGIASNKLLAKLASEMVKPDGLTVLQPSDVPDVLEALPVRDLCGIGKKMEEQLRSFGIKTCGDLGRFPVRILRDRFGVTGDHLHRMGLGLDDSPVVPVEEADDVKSVSHSMTLETDIEKDAEIRKRLLQLSERVGRRARRHEVRGKTVTLWIRYRDFSSITRQLTRQQHTDDSSEIFSSACSLLQAETLMQPVRALGVRLSNLCRRADQLPLFEDEGKRALIGRAMDRVNDKFGSGVTFGSVLGEERGSKVISPSWRPEGARNVEFEEPDDGKRD